MAAVVSLGLSIGAPAWAEECSRTIEGNDKMPFSMPELRVRADCGEVTITLKHTGQLPVTAMGHNFVLTRTSDYRSLADDALAAGAPSDIPEGDARIIAESGIDWSRPAERYRAAIARRLERTVLPDLTSHVVTSCVRTPADFEDRFSAFRGAGFGLDPILTQTGWFRPHNLSEEIPGLYLVGAGTHPGAGIPGVLSSAKVLEAVLQGHARA